MDIKERHALEDALQAWRMLVLVRAYRRGPSPHTAYQAMYVRHTLVVAE